MKDEKNAYDILRDMIITIDGPAGSGKSTTAQALSKRLQLKYIDTGSMYRAVTWKVLRAGIDPEDGESVARIAGETSLEIDTTEEAPVLIVDGEVAGSEIRGPEVSEAVSPVSRHPGVRRAMVRIQRRIGNRGGIVAEGRDTGSAVFPYAQAKIFLVADMDARIDRRVKQLRQMGMTQTGEQIRENLTKRDRIDSGREHSPLVRPVGAFVVDTSDVTIEEQVALIEEIVRREAARITSLYKPRGKNNPFKSGRNAYYSVAQAMIRLFARIIFGLKVIGDENLRFSESFFFASNHISWYDPPLVGCTLQREIWFVAKKELFRNSFFSWLIKKYHAIPIDREGFDRSTVKAIDGAFDRGDSVLMFPEGTRSKTGRIKEFKPGMGMIAYRSGKTIVPVYISGSNALKECLLRKRSLVVRIGRPIRIPDGCVSDDRKKDYAVLSSMIHQAMIMLEDETHA
jgi:cytidylate kinase